MPSSKDYLYFILEQLAPLNEVTYRAMMGEFLLYYRGKIYGGIYDDRLLVKNNPCVSSFISVPRLELPYEGAKPMVMVEEIDDSDFLCELVLALYKGVPAPKKGQKS